MAFSQGKCAKCPAPQAGAVQGKVARLPAKAMLFVGMATLIDIKYQGLSAPVLFLNEGVLASSGCG